MRGKIYRKLSINWYLMNSVGKLCILNIWYIDWRFYPGGWFVYKIDFCENYPSFIGPSFPRNSKTFTHHFQKPSTLTVLWTMLVALNDVLNSFVIKEKWFSVLFFISFAALDLAPPWSHHGISLLIKSHLNFDILSRTNGDQLFLAKDAANLSSAKKLNF